MPYLILLGSSVLLVNLFTAAFRPDTCDQEFGASKAVMGCIASELIRLYFNFRKMNRLKWVYSLWFGAITGISILYWYFKQQYIDLRGLFGGFLGGVYVTGFLFHKITRYYLPGFCRLVF